MFVFAIVIAVKLINLQFVEGDKYRELAEKNTTRNFVIPASRGNIYADDGSLLATSVPKYDIRFDAVTVSSSDFKKYLPELSIELGKMLGKPASYYQNKLRKARANKNRFLFIAKNLGYSDYIRIKSFPLFNIGPYKGGFIAEQRTVREHPIGKIAERTIGHQQKDKPGTYSVGLEGAFHEYLQGKDGKRLKQKIAKGQWKPVFDTNEVEPQDGYDLISTINVNIQDIAHHALLKQLEYYEAEHGCVIVMDVKTGEIKAASTVIDTETGMKVFYKRKIYDSQKGGYGEISAAKALEVSSNIGLATIIDDAYSKEPQKFIDRINSFSINEKIGIPIKGEGTPVIPGPRHKLWSKNALPSIAYGYNLRLTPLQTLTFYNAIANDGVMVKPRFISELKVWNQPVKKFEKEIINPKICSQSTLDQIQEILKNIVVRGTGKNLYSPYFSMAGKTGTAQTEYWMTDWGENRRYVSSFAGYFPAENPKYSCIVIIHKPSIKKGYYGADVSGPVFKRIAQKIFTDSPMTAEVTEIDKEERLIKYDYEKYYLAAQSTEVKVPNVIGMAGMDAVSLLENLGLNVRVIGTGTVSKQSLEPGNNFAKGNQITLNLS
jgi:cell division protein FtsI (penicillin-binding protein 3)